MATSLPFSLTSDDCPLQPGIIWSTLAIPDELLITVIHHITPSSRITGVLRWFLNHENGNLGDTFARARFLGSADEHSANPTHDFSKKGPKSGTKRELESGFWTGQNGCALGVLPKIRWYRERGICFVLRQTLKNPPGEGTEPTESVICREIDVGRVPSRGVSWILRRGSCGMRM